MNVFLYLSFLRPISGVRSRAVVSVVSFFFLSRCLIAVLSCCLGVIFNCSSLFYILSLLVFIISHALCRRSRLLCIEFFCSDTLAGSLSLSFSICLTILFFSPYFCYPISFSLSLSFFFSLFFFSHWIIIHGRRTSLQNFYPSLSVLFVPVTRKKLFVWRSSFSCNIITKEIDADVSIPAPHYFYFNF